MPGHRLVLVVQEVTDTDTYRNDFITEFLEINGKRKFFEMRTEKFQKVIRFLHIFVDLPSGTSARRFLFLIDIS